MTRYNLVSPRPRKDGKTHWHNVGSAFTRDQGGFSLVFDSLPLPDEKGQVRLLMTEPLPRDGERREPQRQASPDLGGDEIPF